MINYNRKTQVLQFSGENNGIYIIRDKEHATKELEVIDCVQKIEQMVSGQRVLYELKADRMPAAIYLRMDDSSSCSVRIENFDRI